jgi:hypothetical protein
MPTSTKALIRAAIAQAIREGIAHHTAQAALATSDDERAAHLAEVAARQRMLDRGEALTATRH